MLKMSEKEPHINRSVTRRAFGDAGVTVPAGVSSYRTALHFVNGTVASTYNLNNIINPVIVLLHEQHRSNLILMFLLIEVASSGKGCWRLVNLKWNGLHFLQT